MHRMNSGISPEKKPTNLFAVNKWMGFFSFPTLTLGQKYLEKYVFELIIASSVLVLPAKTWRVGRQTGGTEGSYPKNILKEIAVWSTYRVGLF